MWYVQYKYLSKLDKNYFYQESNHKGVVIIAAEVYDNHKSFA